MKQIISLLLIALVAFGAWKGWEQWQKYTSGRDLEEAQQAAAASFDPGQLAGMPQQWEAAYKQATNGGLKTWTAWMKNFGQRVDDPRRAWLELDYMVKISLENPQEAKSIFASVKDRTPTNSPVYPRIQQLQKTYE
jgi:hypothetical protein